MTGSTLSMTWSRSAIGGQPVDYLVEAALSPGGPVVGAISNGSVVPTFTFPGVPPGQYFLRVRARNGSGVSLPSPEVGVVVGSPICAPPAEVALQSTVTGSNVVLQWTPPTGFGTSYTLHVGSAPGRSDVLVFNAGSGTSISGAGPAGAFFARVVASGPCGVAAATPDALVSIGGVAPPPLPLATAQATGSTVAIDWTAVANAARYVVEAGSGPLLTDIASIDTTQPGLAGNGVPPGTYSVRVKAFAANGLSSTSRELVIIVR
jgi:hypothetical protein